MGGGGGAPLSYVVFLKKCPCRISGMSLRENSYVTSVTKEFITIMGNVEDG